MYQGTLNYQVAVEGTEGTVYNKNIEILRRALPLPRTAGGAGARRPLHRGSRDDVTSHDERTPEARANDRLMLNKY